MWSEFYDDIKGEKFKSYEDYTLWVKKWVDKTKQDKCLFIETELKRIEKWAKSFESKRAEDELNIFIKGD